MTNGAGVMMTARRILLLFLLFVFLIVAVEISFHDSQRLRLVPPSALVLLVVPLSTFEGLAALRQDPAALVSHLVHRLVDVDPLVVDEDGIHGREEGRRQDHHDADPHGRHAPVGLGKDGGDLSQVGYDGRGRVGGARVSVVGGGSEEFQSVERPRPRWRGLKFRPGAVAESGGASRRDVVDGLHLASNQMHDFGSDARLVVSHVGDVHSTSDDVAAFVGRAALPGGVVLREGVVRSGGGRREGDDFGARRRAGVVLHESSRGRTAGMGMGVRLRLRLRLGIRDKMGMTMISLPLRDGQPSPPPPPLLHEVAQASVGVVAVLRVLPEHARHGPSDASLNLRQDCRVDVLHFPFQWQRTRLLRFIVFVGIGSAIVLFRVPTRRRSRIQIQTRSRIRIQIQTGIPIQFLQQLQLEIVLHDHRGNGRRNFDGDDIPSIVFRGDDLGGRSGAGVVLVVVSLRGRRRGDGGRRRRRRRRGWRSSSTSFRGKDHVAIIARGEQFAGVVAAVVAFVVVLVISSKDGLAATAAASGSLHAK
mmetsp:Transcript_29579/g.61383  ORF Transcript_29579/g.61383 Transcript_29579/m.61383 type:complete len:533 (+) Transcript_29579:1492-3090(+)